MQNLKLAELMGALSHALDITEAFGQVVAMVSAAHHERLDGKGYPKGMADADIVLETRIITTAERPYRGAVPLDKTLAMMAQTVGTAIDADCFASLKRVIRQSPELFPR